MLQTPEYPKSFKLVDSKYIQEISGWAYVFDHVASGAKLLFMKNDDFDKSFSISFKTPPKDSTGVFHILEHSVLCGSERYPVKEPFVNLLKSSMQTFLNAMTFSDKTMYPVSSTNLQDLKNLMDIYLDAVFFPRIYQEKKIFEQEGWHLELADEQDKLRLNGVVYNEMKGVFSDPDSVIYAKVNELLFEGTSYGFESGGHPANIPDLTYEAYLAEHAQHYRLDNSYITLYGDLDINEMLSWLDARLSKVKPHSKATARQLECAKPVVCLDAQVEMNTAKENATCAFASVTGNVCDHKRQVAAGILMQAIMGSNQSPLKAALLNSQLAQDVYHFIDDARLQPVLFIGMKNTVPNAAQSFLEVLQSTAQKLADTGIDPQLIKGALTHLRFLLREGNFGYSAGVIHSMNAMGTWLYDQDAAWLGIEYEALFDELMDLADTDYFNKLLRELILDSNHCCLVDLVPNEDLNSAESERLRLAEETLSPEDRKAIVKNTAALHAFQEAGDDPQDVAKLPQLHLTDIAEAPKQPESTFTGQSDDQGLSLLRHHIETHGISYVRTYYHLEHLCFEDLAFASSVANCLGKLDTTSMNAYEIELFAQHKLGKLSFAVGAFSLHSNPKHIRPTFTVTISCLDEHLAEGLNFLDIILNESILEKERLITLLKQAKLAYEQAFMFSGNAQAAQRLQSKTSILGRCTDATSGIEHYENVTSLLTALESNPEPVLEKLNKILVKLRSSQRMVSFTGSDEAFDVLRSYLDEQKLPEPGEKRFEAPDFEPCNEAFIVPTDVNYVAQGGSFEYLNNETLTGDWLVASRILSLDYLWNQVRVKGGAYGCSFTVRPHGFEGYSSYRDPNLGSTLERYRKAADFLQNFNPDDREFEGYLIATTASLDAPLKPQAKSMQLDGAYLTKRDPKTILKRRCEVIASTVKDIRNLAQKLERIQEAGCVCAFVSQEAFDAWDETEKEALNIKAQVLIG